MSIPLPQGFRLAVAAAGFKQSGRNDLALAVSDIPASAAGMFTTNLFRAAPVQVGQRAIREGRRAMAVLINTGQANACTGEEGLANCLATLEMVGEATGIPPTGILPGSTGVIGAQLKMDAWKKAVPDLAANLGKATVEEFAAAMMTTDSFPKFAGETLSLGGGRVTLAAVAKGAGMICPTMATMLSVALCDGEVAPDDWQAIFERATETTFNRASVDGDTSTNDTIYGLANGASGVKVAGGELEKLEHALTRILAALAYMLVQDGEGASKVMHVRVTGAASDADAASAARTVGHSQLVKTAMYGKDANWGRIVAALGRAGVPFDPAEVRVSLCGVELFRAGQPADLDFDALLQAPLRERDIFIDISLGSGSGKYTLLASDLTHEYITINADYRS
jgi:glutamate N-acetyltransferase/amino-acid N-acetyltransferase